MPVSPARLEVNKDHVSLTSAWIRLWGLQPPGLNRGLLHEWNGLQEKKREKVWRKNKLPHWQSHTLLKQRWPFRNWKGQSGLGRDPAQWWGADQVAFWDLFHSWSSHCSRQRRWLWAWAEGQKSSPCWLPWAVCFLEPDTEMLPCPQKPSRPFWVLQTWGISLTSNPFSKSLHIQTSP